MDAALLTYHRYANGPYPMFWSGLVRQGRLHEEALRFLAWTGQSALADEVRRTRAPRVMNAMILAAGKGTRLYPMTETLAKPMVPIGGRPVLEHTVRWLRHHGIRRVAVNLHHRPESVSGHFGDGSRFGVEIRYSEEPELLGTAGGVKRIESFFEDPFLVVYGDVLTDLDLGALVTFHRSKGTVAHATLALDRRPDAAQGGVVELDRGQSHSPVRREAPPRARSESPWVNSGSWCWTAHCWRGFRPGRTSDFGREILPEWLPDGVPVYGWPLPAGTFLIDVGSPESYARAEREWRQSAAPAGIEPRSVGRRHSSAAATSAWSDRLGAPRNRPSASTLPETRRRRPAGGRPFGVESPWHRVGPHPEARCCDVTIRRT